MSQAELDAMKAAATLRKEERNRARMAERKAQESADSARIAAMPKVDWTACVHRGEEIRTEGCVTCRGSIAIKVFACSELGECTIGKRIGKIAVCTGCESFIK